MLQTFYQKVFLIASFLVVIAIAFPHAFFAPTLVFKPAVYLCLETASLQALFYSSKDLLSVIGICIVDCIIFLWQ